MSLYLGSTQNLVAGNLIGTDITGLAALPAPLNEGYGVIIDGGSTGNTIGGTTAAARNVISGNAGVVISDSTTAGNLVLGNLIGSTNQEPTPSPIPAMALRSPTALRQHDRRHGRPARAT